MTTLIEVALDAAPIAPCIDRRDITVTLGPHEVMIAQTIGSQRNRESGPGPSVNPDRPTFADPADIDGNHRDGCGAELAVGRFLNCYPYAFSGDVEERKRADVGDYQVRQTRHATGHLLIQKFDRDAQRFILVTGVLPTYCIVGWAYARDCKRPEYWRQGRNGIWSFWAPRDRLRGFSMTTNGRDSE